MADTGPGIAEEHLPHLFDRFYQPQSTTTRTHEGTGIGLALVKELVELHGGDVAVESTLGFGTSFTVRLPHREVETTPDETLVPAAETTPDEMLVRDAPLRNDPAPGGGLEAGLRPLENERRVEPRDDAEETPLVLVVEDNADMRAYIRSHLEGQFDIIEAENGRTGFELAREQVPDLVLSDIMMPEVDGLELCATLKADERTSHIPVVLLTARAHVESRIEGFESGADGYLSKPFNAEELRVRVRTLVLERRRLRARFAALSRPHGDASEEGTAETPSVTPLPPREAAFLEKVQTAIEARLADSTYGVDRLADELSMSPRQLYRKLHALIGETPAGLIRQLRMKHAGITPVFPGPDSVLAKVAMMSPMDSWLA